MIGMIGTKLDYFIILFYFVAIFIFGSFFARFTRTTRDFFFGNQRFAWWVIAFSCIATTVGSYSFIKYAAAGYRYGLSSSMTYLNDWIVMPLFLLTWLPVIYFSRVSSVPEYFEKRFDTPSRTMATLFILLYMIGYIGINLYTMGVAMNALMGTDIFWSAVLVAVVCGLYVAAGGQTAVIMTDLVQGFLLLVAGLLLFGLGLAAVGGWDPFWGSLPESWRLPLAHYNSPHNFHFVGIFWQDGIANNIVYYFVNQGLILRFLSLKSTREAKKTFLFVILVLMPLGAIAVANVGWIGKSMEVLGLLAPDQDPNKIFVTVSAILAGPGVFGIVMAALTAALMSTIDTLLNAVSVVVINDIYRPYLVREKSDLHYLKAARWITIFAAAIGILLVPVFAGFQSIYVAHGAFTAAVTPPMAVAVFLGVFWKRFTPKAAFWTMLGGAVVIVLSMKFPALISPFSHGVDPSGGFKYLRALFGLVVSGVIGVAVTCVTKPRALVEIEGLVVGTIRQAMEKYKGGPVNIKKGETIEGNLEIVPGTKRISVHPAAMERLQARVGDLIYVADARWWLGGLRSVHAFLDVPHRGDPDTVRITDDLIQEGVLIPARRHRVEKIF